MKATLKYYLMKGQLSQVSVSLVIFVVNVGQSPLLWRPLHPVASPHPQTVDDIHGVVAGALQHEPPVRAVQEAGRLHPGVFLLQSLPVSGVQTWAVSMRERWRTGGPT